MIRRLWVIVCDPCGVEAPNGRASTPRLARAIAHRAGFRVCDGVDRCPACRALALTTDAAPAALVGQAA